MAFVFRHPFYVKRTARNGPRETAVPALIDFLETRPFVFDHIEWAVASSWILDCISVTFLLSKSLDPG